MTRFFRGLFFLLALAATADAGCTAEEVFRTASHSRIESTVTAGQLIYLVASADELREEPQSVWRIDMRNGSKTMLWSGGQEIAQVDAIAADATSLIYISRDAAHLWSAPLGGGAHVLLATSERPGGEIVFRSPVSDGNHAYWIVNVGNEQRADEIWRVPVSGGNVEVIATGLLLPQSHSRIALSGADVYMVNPEGLYRVPKRGGVVALVFSSPDLQALTAGDDTSVWFTAAPLVTAQVRGGVYDVQIWRIADPNLVPRLFASSFTFDYTAGFTTALAVRTVNGRSQAYLSIDGTLYFLVPFSILSVAYENGAIQVIDSSYFTRVIAADPPALYARVYLMGQVADAIARFCIPSGERRRVIGH